MHCTNCGSYIPPGARFCAGCGAAAPDPEMTRLARTKSDLAARHDESGEIERAIFEARPTMIFITLGYVAAALSAILLTIILAYAGAPSLLSVLVALPLLLIPAYYHLKRQMIRYLLTDSKIVIDQGLLSRTTRNIPLRNIQDVTVSASIPQRLLGFGNLIIENASEQGGTVILHNIPDPRHHADLLLREIRRSR
ncbi:MAG TPA: PH domain-containing protein [Pyrinomonadaceae bacterium]|nr:PH domain-containing protein [Pyrinomonadaceae bacterium]